MPTLNPTYSTAIFLWDASDPTHNLINNASATGGTVGSAATNSLGETYRDCSSNSVTELLSATLPSSGQYCLAAKLVFPTGSLTAAGQITIRTDSSGGGFRLEPTTTLGGVHITPTHTGVAVGTDVATAYVFDNQPWGYVANYNGTVLKQYVLAPGAAALTTFSASDTIGYSNPTATGNMELGGGVAGGSMQSFMVLPAALSDPDALTLANNVSAMFASGASASLGGSAGTGGTGTASPVFSIGL